MKNIFIGGVAKSGKSRLAVELCKKNHMNHIPLDYFASSFKHYFPEIGIVSNVMIDEKSSELLAKFLSRFIEIADSMGDEFFIVDSAHILPHDILPYLNPEKWDIYYLGYPSMTSNEKFDEVMQYANDGWVAKKSKEELLKTLDGLIHLSKMIEKECREYSIPFINTSRDDVIRLLKDGNILPKSVTL